MRSIQEPTERLLVEASLAHALSFLASDEDYQKRFSAAPLDLLTFARGTYAFLRRQGLIRKILDGEIAEIDDLDPFAAR